MPPDAKSSRVKSRSEIRVYCSTSFRSVSSAASPKGQFKDFKMAVKRRITKQPERDMRAEAPCREGGSSKRTDRPFSRRFLVYAASLVFFRMFAALMSPITDCDEVFNYWEPLHFLFHGTGLQTWEYSPTYAIRSYALLLVLKPAFWLCKMFNVAKRTEFYVVRACLALYSAFGDVCLSNMLQCVFSRKLADYVRWMQVFAAGMFISSPALLPSSLSMSLTTYAYASWLVDCNLYAVLCVGLSVLLCWPFAALIGFPIALEMLIRRNGRELMCEAVVFGMLILAYLVPVDSYFYGKITVTPLNIVLYNVFSEYGPELYGVEPFSYYPKNLLLNWNIAFPLALMCTPLMLCRFFLNRSSRPTFSRKAKYMQMAMYLWMFVFFSQKHKEERFLYPMYPMLCVNAATSLYLLSLYGNYLLRKWKPISNAWRGLPSAVLVIFAVISLSRSLHLVSGFSAPFSAYSRLQEMANGQQNATICVGKEWHRFPGSFFLSDVAKLGFLRSEFRGQLPNAFSSDLPIPQSTRLIPTHMNDMNAEEPTRYVPMNQCNYLVDMMVDDASATPLEPNYALMTDKWKNEFTADFLIASKSGSLCRSFYIPFSRSHCRYAKYVLLSKIG
uniref:Mannosyltransferase n=1 Tax=Trichuris muris TaxID=70415 RepID=A0A5S6Q9A6_TRIMR